MRKCDKCGRKGIAYADGKRLCRLHAALDPALVFKRLRESLWDAVDVISLPLVWPVLLIQQALTDRRAKKLGLALFPSNQGFTLGATDNELTLLDDGRPRWDGPLSSLSNARIVKVPDDLYDMYDPTLVFTTDDGVEWRLPCTLPEWSRLVDAMRGRGLLAPES